MPNCIRMTRNMYTSYNLNRDQDIVLVHILLTPERWEPYNLPCRMSTQCGANQQANRLAAYRGLFGSNQAYKERDSVPLFIPTHVSVMSHMDASHLLHYSSIQKIDLRVGATMLHQPAIQRNFTLYVYTSAVQHAVQQVH